MPHSYWSAEYCIQKTQKKLYKLMRNYVEKITLLPYTVFNNWTWSIKKPVNIEKASIRASQLISSMCSKCYFTSLRNLLFSLLSILQCILSIKLHSKIENRLNKFNNLLMIVVTINMKQADSYNVHKLILFGIYIWMRIRSWWDILYNIEAWNNNFLNVSTE